MRKKSNVVDLAKIRAAKLAKATKVRRRELIWAEKFLAEKFPLPPGSKLPQPIAEALADFIRALADVEPSLVNHFGFGRWR